MDSDNEMAYDVAFAELVADMIGVKAELEEGNTDEALRMVNETIEENKQAAHEVLD